MRLETRAPDALGFKNSEGRDGFIARCILKRPGTSGRKGIDAQPNRNRPEDLKRKKKFWKKKKLKRFSEWPRPFLRGNENRRKTREIPFPLCLKDFAKQSYDASEISLLNLNEIIETSVTLCRSTKGIDPIPK